MKGVKQIFQSSWNAIKKHKILFILLIFIQFIYVALFAFTSISFQVEIINDAQKVVNLFQTANFDEQQLSEGVPFIENAFELQQHYSSIQRNVIYFLLSVFGYMLTFHAWLWILPFYMKKKQNLLRLWAHYATHLSIIFIPLTLITYLVLSLSVFTWQINPEIFPTLLSVIGVVYLVAYLFFILTLGSIQEKKHKQKWYMIKKYFKKPTQYLTGLGVNIILIAAALALVYLTISVPSLNKFVVITTILIMIVLSLARIIWSNTYETNHR